MPVERAELALVALTSAAVGAAAAIFFVNLRSQSQPQPAQPPALPQEANAEEQVQLVEVLEQLLVSWPSSPMPQPWRPSAGAAAQTAADTASKVSSMAVAVPAAPAAAAADPSPAFIRRSGPTMPMPLPTGRATTQRSTPMLSPPQQASGHSPPLPLQPRPQAL